MQKKKPHTHKKEKKPRRSKIDFNRPVSSLLSSMISGAVSPRTSTEDGTQETRKRSWSECLN